MPARRLQDRIRDLCTQLLCAEEPLWTDIAEELEVALTEQLRRTEALLFDEPDVFIERRKMRHSPSGLV